MIPKITFAKKGKLVFGLDEDTTVWKKAIIFNTDEDGVEWPDMAIVKLTIPKNAKVILSAHKCRASCAKVEGIYPIESCEPAKPLDNKIAYSWYKYPCIFSYKVGKIVWPMDFNPDPDNICSSGIHFFRTYKEAAEYEFY